MAKTLYVRIGSRYRVAKSVEILDAAAHVEARQLEVARPKLSNPQLAQAFLIGQIAHCPQEFFCVLFLDAQHRVIAFDRMFRGTVDSASVHVREVVRDAVSHNATEIIVAHNHPSGTLDPSYADEQITRKLIEALKYFDIRVLDHIIVTANGCYSFADRGKL